MGVGRTQASARQEGLALRSSVLGIPRGLQPELVGPLCFLYGVGVSLRGGAATWLPDPNREEWGSSKLLGRGRWAHSKEGGRSPFPGLLCPPHSLAVGPELCDLFSGPRKVWMLEGVWAALPAAPHRASPSKGRLLRSQ